MNFQHLFEQDLERALSDIDGVPAAGRPQPRPPAAPSDACRQIGKQPSPQAPQAPVLQLQGREPPFRPVLRPAVPILTVLDDGSLETGEQVRLRRSTLVIGRTSGDLLIPNDITVSGRHGEIRLTERAGKAHWTLHDLESANGTFVRVNAVNLAHDTIVLLGRRRFRLEQPAILTATPTMEGTRLVATTPRDEAMMPTLVELSAVQEGGRFPLRSHLATIGRIGHGCAIELDDPLVAPMHAELRLTDVGTWRLTAVPSTNGLWVSTQATRLSNLCYFQCGEQRFRFCVQ